MLIVAFLGDGILVFYILAWLILFYFILAFGSEEAKLQLSSILPNLGSSDTSHLQHAGEVWPQWDQSHTPEMHRGEVGGMSAVAPRSAPCVSPKEVGDDKKRLVSGTVWGLQVNWSFGRDRPRGRQLVPSAFALITKAIKEPLRLRKKQRNTKHSGKITSDGIVTIAQHMPHPSLARELSGTMKEISGTPSLWAAVFVGGRRPHDITDDIDSGDGMLR